LCLAARQRSRGLPRLVEHPDALERERGAVTYLLREALRGERADQRHASERPVTDVVERGRLLDQRDLLKHDRGLAASLAKLPSLQ